MQEDFQHILIINRHCTGKKYRQSRVLIQRFLQTVAAAYRYGQWFFRDDIKLAAIPGKKLHFTKQLLVAFHGAQLESATILRAVTQRNSSGLHHDQSIDNLSLAVEILIFLDNLRFRE